MKLRVCHFPRISCKPFTVEVENLREALKITRIFKDYEHFLSNNKIQNNILNITIVEEWSEKSQQWREWDCGGAAGITDIEEYFEEMER